LPILSQWQKGAAFESLLLLFFIALAVPNLVCYAYFIKSKSQNPDILFGGLLGQFDEEGVITYE
jgi:hypothetical protein